VRALAARQCELLVLRFWRKLVVASRDNRQASRLRSPIKNTRLRLTIPYRLRAVSAMRRTDLAALLNKSSFAKITEISVRRALDQIDREFEQANLPGFVYALNDGAERFLEMLHF